MVNSRKSGRRAHHWEDLPGDPGSIIRSQEHDSMRNVVRGPHPAHGDAFEEGFLPLWAPALPLRFVIGAGAQEPGRDSVHRDAELTQLARKLAHEAKLAVLGGRIRLNPGEARRERSAAGDRDNAALAGALHAGRDGLRKEKRAGEVRI